MNYLQGVQEFRRTPLDKNCVGANSQNHPKWKKVSSAKALPCWPRLLRAVCAWLTPGLWLARCWAAFVDTAPPAEFATLPAP